MRDSISIGCSPWAEDCAQVGTDNYHQRARKECAAFVNQIRRVVGLEPHGARLRIKSNPHDFGDYLEVECVYDDACETAVNYAFECEGHKGLEYWDAQAKTELGLTVAEAA